MVWLIEDQEMTPEILYHPGPPPISMSEFDGGNSMGFFGSIGKVLGGVAKVGFATLTGGPLAGAGALVNQFRPTTPQGYVNPPPPLESISWPPTLPMVATGSAGGSPVNSFQPPALGVTKPVLGKTTAKRKAAPKRKAKPKAKAKKKAPPRKPKFGSPAYRKKYLGTRR